MGHTVFEAEALCAPLCLAKQQSYSFLLYPKLCLRDLIWHRCTEAEFSAFAPTASRIVSIANYPSEKALKEVTRGTSGKACGQNKENTAVDQERGLLAMEGQGRHGSCQCGRMSTCIVTYGACHPGMPEWTHDSQNQMPPLPHQGLDTVTPALSLGERGKRKTLN